MRKEFERQLQKMQLPKEISDGAKPKTLIGELVGTITHRVGSKNRSAKRVTIPSKAIPAKVIAALDGHLFHQHSLRIVGVQTKEEVAGEVLGSILEPEFISHGMLLLIVEKVSKEERHAARRGGKNATL